MNPEQQRIAVTEACGWVKEVGVTGIQRWRENRGELCEHTPDYLNDLNAMHEAEEILTTAQRMDYADILCDLQDGIFSGVMANAAQRAGAFLKTLNLWKP